MKFECLKEDEWCEVWERLAKKTGKEVRGESSLWLKMEEVFNQMVREFIVSASLHDIKAILRLVLNDDKIHCESDPIDWDDVKRVKHVMCNCFETATH